MIAYLEGIIQFIGENYLVVIVNGVGYKVFMPAPLLLAAKVGEKTSLHTHTHVREDALDLFGFTRQEELVMFESLIALNGIGPRIAMNVLAMTTPEQLRTAVASGNVGLLTKVSGIGKKMAERLIIELKDTFVLEEKRRGAEAGVLFESDIEVIEALERLGYSKTEARQAVEALPKDLEGMEVRLKSALKNLGTTR